MNFICWESLFYTIHLAAHYVSRWKVGRRMANHHLSHHAFRTGEYEYTHGKIYRQIMEIAGLICTGWFLRDDKNCVNICQSLIAYKISHTLQHTLPPGVCIRDHHKYHHQSPKHNLGVTSPLHDVVLGRLHPKQRVRKGWRALLLPFPILGFWALENV